MIVCRRCRSSSASAWLYKIPVLCLETPSRPSPPSRLPPRRSSRRRGGHSRSEAHHREGPGGSAERRFTHGSCACSCRLRSSLLCQGHQEAQNHLQYYPQPERLHGIEGQARSSDRRLFRQDARSRTPTFEAWITSNGAAYNGFTNEQLAEHRGVLDIRARPAGPSF